METIDEIIARAFPKELIDARRFTDWCEEAILEHITPIAANIINEIEKLLEKEKKKASEQEKIHRDYWDLFGHKKPIKSIKSIRSKLARDINDEEKAMKVKIADRLTMETIEVRIYQLSDLARVRIISTFHADSQRLASVLLNNNLFLNQYECPKGIKDFIYDPDKRDGLKGHRARQFASRIPLENNRTFGFEVQLMTLLQHAWDRRNHPMYEWLRENKELSSELRVNDFSCSEALHVVDQQADRNWEQFLKEIQQHGK